MGSPLPVPLIVCLSIISIEMIKTKNKEFRQILVDSDNHKALHTKYGAGRTYNDAITEVLRDHEIAVSVISDCEHCRELFKAAVAVQR